MKKLLRLFITLTALNIPNASNAVIINDIDFPDKVAEFRLIGMIDSEKNRPGQGLGKSLHYAKEKIVLSIYVYDLNYKNITNNITAHEFQRAKSDIINYNYGVEITSKNEYLKIGNTEYFHSLFLTRRQDKKDEAPDLSDLYMVTHNGNFIKIRATYPSKGDLESIRKNQIEFLLNLEDVLSKSIMNSKPVQ